MARTINLNADVAEGFGAYDIGDDAGVMESVASANIACGFHAGDPSVMRRVVALATAKGVSIGAHPGFNDLWGFGRRRIDMRAADLENMVAYQIGALQGVAALCGATVAHLKPHGALYNMAAENADYAQAIGRAIKGVDPALVYVGLPGSQMEHAARALGLAFAGEGFCDRQYEDNGALAARGGPGAVLSDPAAAARQALDMALTGEVVARSGRRIACKVETLCVHGDEPTGAAVARAVRAALEGAGVRVVALTEAARY